MALKFKRTRAGHYQATLTDGAIAEVEYVDFREDGYNGYGDHGWVWWCDGSRSDFPVDTKWYAVELLENYIENVRPDTLKWLRAQAG